MDTGRCLPVGCSSLHVNWLVSLNRDWSQAMYNLYGWMHQSPSYYMKNILFRLLNYNRQHNTWSTYNLLLFINKATYFNHNFGHHEAYMNTLK
jgi:hypothetical protein